MRRMHRALQRDHCRGQLTSRREFQQSPEAQGHQEDPGRIRDRQTGEENTGRSITTTRGFSEIPPDQTMSSRDKSNILLVGPTGRARRFWRDLAKILHVPFAIVDATSPTEAGYVGEDVENILLRLIQNADGDVKKAEASSISMRSTRSPVNPTTLRSPGTFRARECSRPF